MQVETVLFFETPAEIFARVYRELRPRAAAPPVAIEWKKYANANSSVRMRDGRLELRLADMLAGAPAPVLEALAWILLSKLFRRRPPAACQQRFRRYLNRGDVHHTLNLVRQARGRKVVGEPQGERFNLEEIFDALNARFFDGLLIRPRLGWSKGAARWVLGHYDAPHNAIVLSRALDRAETPRLAVEYVMYHEMLHLRHPEERRGARRHVHTAAFRQAERQFPGWKEAKEALRRL